MPSFTKSLLATIAAALLASPALATDYKYVYTDPAQANYQMPYNLFLPSDYNPNGAPLPVIISLHGLGECGTDNNAQLKYLSNVINETQGAVPAHDAIIIAPQCPTGQVWNGVNAGNVFNMGSYTNAQQKPVTQALQVVMDILTHTQATANTNKRKVYITGLSMGGYGSWDAITQFPNTFAAAMPLSGGGNVDAASKLVNTPIWAYHGTLDGSVPASGDTNPINAIIADGGHPIYSLIPGYGHGNWDEFYTPHHWTTSNPTTTGGSGPDLYTWMFAQTLAPEPTTLALLALAALPLLSRRRPR